MYLNSNDLPPTHEKIIANYVLITKKKYKIKPKKQWIL